MADDITEILEATAEAVGHTLQGFRPLQEQVYGDGIIRSFDLQLQGPSGQPVSQVVYVETSPAGEPRDGILVFRDEASDDEVAVWLYPTDPELPALPTAVFPHAASIVLQRMGLETEGLQLALNAYRPGKRAVVRARSERTVVWLKVLRPRMVEQLTETYRLWETSGLPVPGVVGWAEEGLVAFTELGDVPATKSVRDLGDAFFDALERLLTDIAAVPSQNAARASLVTKRNWYARKATEKHPELRERIEDALERIDTLMEGVTQPSEVTIHGDMHLAQLFVSQNDPAKITGVLDIDTAGLGDPADDAAALYAHLIVSELFDHGRDHGVPEEYSRLADAWLQRVELGKSGDAGFTHRVYAIAATHLMAHTLGNSASGDALISRAEALLNRS